MKTRDLDDGFKLGVNFSQMLICNCNDRSFPTPEPHLRQGLSLHPSSGDPILVPSWMAQYTILHSSSVQTDQRVTHTFWVYYFLSSSNLSLGQPIVAHETT